MVNIHSPFLQIVAGAKRLPALCPALEQASVATMTATGQSPTIDET